MCRFERFGRRLMVRSGGTRATVALVVAALCALLGGGATARADGGAPLGSVAGSVTFAQGCGSGIGVGIAFDGDNLWYSCYDSSPDLLRADPKTGAVTATYDVDGGLGALAYDAKR